ncbi:MAG TPA: sigma-54-dependent Fis family transcriptional regulator [Bacteroidetes bacterium]|nr:sigma-54-dependent Fis family transcriptional regulator [Bacteroidota bacterium]
MSKGRILVADDEKVITGSLKKILGDSGYDIMACETGEEVAQQLGVFNPDLLLLDIYLGDSHGIQMLKQLRSDGWEVPIIMMTGFADVTLAVQAMKEGAADFVLKPFDLTHLLVLIEKNLKQLQLQAKVKVLQEEVEYQRRRSGIIGSSSEMRKVLDVAERLAQGESTTVLLEGESGTGKELVARFIHDRSARKDQSFITLNCAAIPKDLAESEFFGYEKGAFTGATERMKEGKFELANNGTILLDEIGELSLDMQVKLLRVLEGKKFYRLGGGREISVEVRVVAATNRNLAKEVEAGRFREDLFYRLNVASIHIPPLRERKDDVDTLAQAFLQEFAKRFSKPAPMISPEVLQFLRGLPWRGNVRELRNAIERVMLLRDVQALTIDHFAFLGSGQHRGQIRTLGFDQRMVLQIPPDGVAMNEVLKDLFLKTFEITKGNQVQAAKILGVTRSKLRYKMEQLGIQPEQRMYRVKV